MAGGGGGERRAAGVAAGVAAELVHGALAFGFHLMYLDWGELFLVCLLVCLAEGVEEACAE